MDNSAATIVTRSVIEKEGMYLMVQEGKSSVKGLWGFPGGKVDAGELLTISAMREIREETGVTAKLTGLINMNYIVGNKTSGFTLIITFKAKAIFIPEAFSITPEVLSVKWMTLKDISQLEQEGQLRNKTLGEVINLASTKILLPLSFITEEVVSLVGV